MNKAIIFSIALGAWLAGCAGNSGPPMTDRAARDLNSVFAGAREPGQAARGATNPEPTHLDEGSMEEALDSLRNQNGIGGPAEAETEAASQAANEGFSPDVTFLVYVAIGAVLLAYLFVLIRRRSRAA